jgi:hypothetical protein
MATNDKRDVVVDSFFGIPPGVVDIRHDNTLDGEFNYSVNDIADDPPTLETPTATIPMPLTSFSVISQVIRLTSDGRSVVDVTFEFPDQTGVQSINIRESKI